jgi:hypothetical protein
MKIEEILQKIMAIAAQDDSTELNDTEVEDGVFMPPLQLNIEMMKKAVGEPNSLNSTQDSDCDSEEEYEGEWQELAADPEGEQLMAIRRNAGLPIDAEIEHPAAIVISQGSGQQF